MKNTSLEGNRVILIGVGGASSAGKSTLTKHLKRILPDSVTIHQDDFVPPQEKIPIHPIHKVQDWDTPATAIDWRKFTEFLRQVKEKGEIPLDHRSYEDLNENLAVEIDEDVRNQWVKFFNDLREAGESRKERITWALVDGFLMYWKQEIVDLLDVSILLRAPEAVLKERRQYRQWHSADESNPEGTSVWRDPPEYWENIVWPAYVEGHKDLFVDGDVENGKLGTNIGGLILLETLEINMSEAVERCCAVLKDVAEK